MGVGFSALLTATQMLDGVHSRRGCRVDGCTDDEVDCDSSFASRKFEFELLMST